MDILARYNLFLEGVANDMRNVLVRTCPVDKGRLKTSIKVKVKDGVLTFYMVDYAVYVEFGTKPHIIKPKTKKSLAWKDGNRKVFAKSVQHPGTRPQPFIRNAFYHKLAAIVAENAERYVPEIASELKVTIE